MSSAICVPEQTSPPPAVGVAQSFDTGLRTWRPECATLTVCHTVDGRTTLTLVGYGGEEPVMFRLGEAERLHLLRLLEKPGAEVRDAA